MEISVVGTKAGTLTPDIERDIYQLRYATFSERLGWDVETYGDQEFDRFDSLEAQYVIAKENGSLSGCWRILPTEGPNMLRDVFPELLDGNAAPCNADTWELSRFAVVRQQVSSFGFSTLPLQMMLEAVRCARQQGVSSFVTVTTLAMERLLNHLHLRPRRLGSPMLIGSVRTVALTIATSGATEDALLTCLSLKKVSASSALWVPASVTPCRQMRGSSMA